MQMLPAIGIDVGGTGIKGAGVNPETGKKLTGRHRVPTPEGATPTDVAAEVSAMVSAIRDELHESGLLDRDAVPPVGVTLPGVVQSGFMRTAANIDEAWIDLDAQRLMSEATGVPCVVVNDADAAGFAEASFGAASDEPGVALVLTFGTGIGSALIHEGRLVPNLELGHIDLGEHADYEGYASPKNIEREGISIDDWAARVAPYMRHLEKLFSPHRFVIGGSISKSSDLFLPFEGVRAAVMPAQFRNNAGIVGAAALATAAGAETW